MLIKILEDFSIYFTEPKVFWQEYFNFLNFFSQPNLIPSITYHSILSQLCQSKMDILSSVKYIQKDHEKHGSRAWTDHITFIDITTVTDLCDIKREAANLPGNALLPHHVHYHHVPNLPVGVADITSSACSPRDEELFLPSLHCVMHVLLHPMYKL